MVPTMSDGSFTPKTTNGLLVMPLRWESCISPFTGRAPFASGGSLTMRTAASSTHRTPSGVTLVPVALCSAPFAVTLVVSTTVLSCSGPRWRGSARHSLMEGYA